MNKVENSLLGFVHPSDDSSTEVLLVKQCLQELGFSETDQVWIVEVFKRPDCFDDPTGEYVFRHEFGTPDVVNGLNSLKERVQVKKENQNTLALLFSLMLGFGPGSNAWLLPNDKFEKSDGSWNIPQWIIEFQQHAAFCAKRLNLHEFRQVSKNAGFQFECLLPFLFPNGVSLNRIVNLNLLDPTQRLQRSNTYLNEFETLEQLEFWLTWRFQANAERCGKVRLDTLLQGFSDLPDEVLGEKILGLLNAIDYAMWNGSTSLSVENRLDPLNDGWRVVARELIPFLELLSDRKPEAIQECSPLLKAWWNLSKHIYNWSMGGLASELSEDLRNRLVESASQHIGMLRSVLRDTPEVFEDENVYDFYDKAFYVLLSFASPWKRLKPLLLAFTEMTEQAVARDLRTWREHDSTDTPPPIFSRVPNWIEVAMYPQNLQVEIQKDPSLQGLRGEFAKFCLGRLSTKEKSKDSGYTNQDFVEPRPAWRGCYVQALKVLGVNPGGRARRTLFWLSKNDPDKGVREYARRVHSRVRHLDQNKPNLDEGTSPRRPLFEAFWWLRQAHLITLDVKVDQAGAMRTRRKELHRTREKDDVLKRR